MGVDGSGVLTIGLSSWRRIRKDPAPERVPGTFSLPAANASYLRTGCLEFEAGSLEVVILRLERALDICLQEKVTHLAFGIREPALVLLIQSTCLDYLSEFILLRRVHLRLWVFGHGRPRSFTIVYLCSIFRFCTRIVMLVIH
jgi:hypothetical protein